MPAASTKPDKASFEANEPIKQVIQVVEKKVRNLEKRKGKLDGYKAKADSGTKLEKDQQAAVDKYDEVMQTLEFARDLQKQFLSINVDAEKMMKKQLKREKIERQNMVLKRMQEMLKVQNLLDSMGSDKVRSDFQTGKHGAVVLTEENLTHLDELYKLISPSRDSKNYAEELTQASEHLLSLMDAKEKEVVGTNYKDLSELLDLINNCGYFENAAAQEEETTEEACGEQEFIVVNSSEVPQADSVEVQASLPPQVIDEQQIEQTNEASQNSVQQQQAEYAEADSFFSKTAATNPAEVSTAAQQQQQQQQQDQTQDNAYNPRPFQDIVSKVQGNFNFLQESTLDMESPHMDPAVVAAHPMPPAPLGHQPESLSSQTFSNQGFGDLAQQAPHDLTSANKESTQSLLSKQQSSLGGASDFPSQTFGQSLQSDALFPSSAVKGNSSQLTQNVMGKSNDNSISKFDIPPSIPMPPGLQSNTQEASADTQAEKKFTMNPNAEMFQSQLYSASATPAQDEFGQQQGDFGRQNYQGNSYNSNYRGNRGGNSGGGGFRGKNNRGGGERGGNMANGFGGGRGGRGGNSYSGNRGGGQGGAFQGFPPRNNDYNNRSDGYQNYNGNFGGNNNSGGFQKRGGGGQPRGNNRGAPRGGAPRGAARGNSRGGQGGGFGRPQQQQTA